MSKTPNHVRRGQALLAMDTPALKEWMEQHPLDVARMQKAIEKRKRKQQ